MQGNTYLPDTSSDEDYSSDSSGEIPKNNNIGVKYDIPSNYGEERFLDQSRKDKYFKIRNELFTRPLETGRICFYTNSAGTSASDYNNVIDVVDNLKLGKIDNVIGFELISANINNNGTQEVFVDLQIPEIPHKACKQNERGIPIISRLKCITSSDNTNFFETEPQRSYNNYFSPISLSTLTLNLFKVDGAKIQNDAGFKVFYEFEITILNQSLSQR